MDTFFQGQPLSDGLLQGFAKRVAAYDRDNRFFTEDFEDLRKAGYLTMGVPRELGGHGLSLAEVCKQQRRLAYHAPATALGINMHVYWIGVAADLWRSGDKSLEWMLREAAAGEVFAAGHAERGNDLPVLLSTAKAERVDGGFKFTGHKMFGSLAPVWTRYGLHGLWADAEGGPKVVHGFMPRDSKGYRIVETWDTLGMRATRSDDVILEGAFVPDKYVARILPAGGADQFVVAVFAWALMGFANVYCGVAQRAFDLAIDAVEEQEVDGRQPDHGLPPGGPARGRRRWRLALDPIAPHLDHVAKDWSDGVDHGATWPSKIVSAKYHCRRGLLEDRRPGDGGVRRRRHVQGPTSSSGCSAMPAAGASIPPTRCSSTRSWRRRRWASISASSRAGAELAHRRARATGARACIKIMVLLGARHWSGAFAPGNRRPLYRDLGFRVGGIAARKRSVVDWLDSFGRKDMMRGFAIIATAFAVLVLHSDLTVAQTQPAPPPPAAQARAAVRDHQGRRHRQRLHLPLSGPPIDVRRHQRRRHRDRSDRTEAAASRDDLYR